MDQQERLRILAVAAADLVRAGMLVGLGTGSTADAVIRELGQRVRDGLSFTGVPTSDRAETLARSLGIPLTTLEEARQLDLGIDGADEIDPSLDAIKGKGGALLHEKLVALACVHFVLVASTEKSVERLGIQTALPVEVVRFGWMQTAGRLSSLGLTPELRRLGNAPGSAFVTDNGGYILDCATGPIANARQLASELKAVSGVVEHGLFAGIANAALQIDPDGTVLRRERPGG